MEQFKNIPLQGPVTHPVTGLPVKACKALVHRFTPTGIFPNRQQRRAMLQPVRQGNRIKQIVPLFEPIEAETPSIMPAWLRKMLGFKTTVTLGKRLIGHKTIFHDLPQYKSGGS